MRIGELSNSVQPLVCRLLDEGLETWLIGSRANGVAKVTSDWDFIVFGSEDLIERLSHEPTPENIDLLIVFDGNNFRSPWPRASDGIFKGGDLARWKWKRESRSTASYESTKLPDDWGTPRKAYLIEA